MKIDTLQIDDSLKKALAEGGISEMTPIQEGAMPILFDGGDLLACAPTGTGKTIAFLLPILSRILLRSGRRGVKALILAPTRELAIQIGREVESLCRYNDIKHGVIIGGESVEEQIFMSGRSLDLVIATPGRLLHLVQEKIINLSSIQMFVVDEGDRLLDMGFIGTIRKIVRFLPRKRQTALFSATLLSDTEDLAKELLKGAKRIDLVSDKSSAPDIAHTIYYVDKQNKMNLLKHLIKEMGIERAIVFVRTKYDAEKVASDLYRAGLDASALHGDKEQMDRELVFRDFRSGRVKILVSTDLAARGIDIPELEWVINFELPNEAETYMHRVGRTARAGASGEAISLCSNAELRFLKPIKKLVGKSKMKIVEQHPFSYAQREKGEARNSASSIGKIRERS
ncbi:MAG: DEAD/DEAH box helicase [Bacteroidales bacterium]